MKNYYVYVYIDPRNYEEFYYGKGKGSRKESHLIDDTDSNKTKRISAIKKEGLEPIIRVIASNLSEEEAYLIEATLLWKLGKYTENKAGGHSSSKFRPLNSMHLELSRFDFQNGIYYYNVGEKKNSHRNWDDYVKYNFISAGQGKQWRDKMLGFQQGDVFVAYLKKHGFVGVGKILTKADMIKNIKINNVPLLDLDLKCKTMDINMNDDEKSEYVCLVKWLKVVPREDAKWKPKSGLYTTTHVRADLSRQKETINFINSSFDIDIQNLII